MRGGSSTSCTLAQSTTHSLGAHTGGKPVRCPATSESDTYPCTEQMRPRYAPSNTDNGRQNHTDSKRVSVHQNRCLSPRRSIPPTSTSPHAAPINASPSCLHSLAKSLERSSKRMAKWSSYIAFRQIICVHLVFSCCLYNIS